MNPISNNTASLNILPRDIVDLCLPAPISFADLLAPQLTCKAWHQCISPVIHKRLVQVIEKLAQKCLQAGLIKENSLQRGGNKFIGMDELLTQAQKSVKEAVRVYRHLECKYMCISNPTNYCRRLLYDRDIPFVPVASKDFKPLFYKKVKEQVQQKQDIPHYFTFFTPDDLGDTAMMAVLVGNSEKSDLYLMKKEDINNNKNSFEIAIKNQINRLNVPIFFSEEESAEMTSTSRKRKDKDQPLHPAVSQAPYYYKDLDRRGAESKLAGCPPNTFLVRPSSHSKFDLFISYITVSGAIFHSGVIVTKKNGYVIEECGLKRKSLPLAIFYMELLVWERQLNQGEEPSHDVKENWAWVYSRPYYLPIYNEEIKNQLINLQLKSFPQKCLFFLYYDEKHGLMKGEITGEDFSHSETKTGQVNEPLFFKKWITNHTESNPLIEFLDRNSLNFGERLALKDLL